MYARVRSWRWTFAVLLSVAASIPSYAGSVSLAWDPVSGASGYRIYYGTSSGQYTQNVNAGNTTQATVTGLADCTNWFLAVKAYNSAGESASFSNEVVGWPRPRVTAASPNARLQGELFTIEVTGANFQPGASIEIDNPDVFLTSTSVLDCNRVQAAVTIEPTAAGVRPARIGSYSVSVINPDNVFGDRAGGFEVRINPARFDVVTQPSVTQGRLDGRDWISLNNAIPSREGTDPSYDPDLDFDGDGWIDGNELAYMRGSNIFGTCWSGTTWTIAACPAGLQ